MRGTGSRSRQNSALSFYHHTNHILPRLFINRQQLRGNTKRGAAYRGLGTITRIPGCCRQVLQIQRISHDSRVLWIGHVVCDEQSSTDNRARSKKSSLHKYFPTSHLRFLEEGKLWEDGFLSVKLYTMWSHRKHEDSQKFDCPLSQFSNPISEIKNNLSLRHS